MSDNGERTDDLASPACLMHEVDPAYMFAAGLPDLAGRPVMLFDGVCVLCRRSVRFILRHERDHALLFAPMQSRAGQMLLARHDLPPDDWDSFVLIEGDRVLTKSRAALALARQACVGLRAPRPSSQSPAPHSFDDDRNRTDDTDSPWKANLSQSH